MMRSQKEVKSKSAEPIRWVSSKEFEELKQRFNKMLQEVKAQEDKSFLVCPDCAKDGGEVLPLYWVNADQLSFGDYVEVRAEATCRECDSYWQIKVPQMVRAQPQNRLSAIGVF